MIQITKICRGYLTNTDRKRAIAQLRRHGYDHFVEYQDVAAKHALCYGKYIRLEKLQAEDLLGLPKPAQLLLDEVDLAKPELQDGMLRLVMRRAG